MKKPQLPNQANTGNINDLNGIKKVNTFTQNTLMVNPVKSDVQLMRRKSQARVRLYFWLIMV